MERRKWEPVSSDGKLWKITEEGKTRFGLVCHNRPTDYSPNLNDFDFEGGVEGSRTEPCGIQCKEVIFIV